MLAPILFVHPFEGHFVFILPLLVYYSPYYYYFILLIVLLIIQIFWDSIFDLLLNLSTKKV